MNSEGKAETFEEWIALGKEKFKDDPDITLITMTPKKVETGELLRELDEYFVRFTVHDVIAAGYTLEPLVCLHCGYEGITYLQYVGDAYCANCGEWQLEE